jgi:hypothetical protein
MTVVGNHLLLALTNTLAFYVMDLITALKSFMIQAPKVDYIKPFFIIVTDVLTL